MAPRALAHSSGTPVACTRPRRWRCHRRRRGWCRHCRYADVGARASWGGSPGVSQSRAQVLGPLTQKPPGPPSRLPLGQSASYPSCRGQWHAQPQPPSPEFPGVAMGRRHWRRRPSYSYSYSYSYTHAASSGLRHRPLRCRAHARCEDMPTAKHWEWPCIRIPIVITIAIYVTPARITMQAWES